MGKEYLVDRFKKIYGAEPTDKELEQFIKNKKVENVKGDYHGELAKLRKKYPSKIKFNE